MNPNPSFEALSLAEPLQRALHERQYKVPTPIQAEAIPPLLAGRDVLGCAQTGTGKTAAFALPVLHKLHEENAKPVPHHPVALVLTPTRELAMQVSECFKGYGTYVRFKQALVYGGVAQRPQVQAMRRGVHVLTATPGRLLDLIDQGHIDLSSVKYFIVDEVDRMLDMGFLPDVRKIVAMLPKSRQSLFFSATLAKQIVGLSESILQNPVRVDITPTVTTAEKVEQRVCFLNHKDRTPLLIEMLKAQKADELSKDDLTLVFSRTKHGARKLAESLNKEGYQADAIHGDRTQHQRERTLDKFRQGKTRILVATDVAARGVDVKGIGMVVNYDLPEEPEAYVHRIGRTARAGAEGLAVSFCTHDSRRLLMGVERQIKQKIEVFIEHPFHDLSLSSKHTSGAKEGRSGGKNGYSKNKGGGKNYGKRNDFGKRRFKGAGKKTANAR